MNNAGRKSPHRLTCYYRIFLFVAFIQSFIPPLYAYDKLRPWTPIHCQGRSPLFHRLCSSLLRRLRFCRSKSFSQSPFRLPASSLKARNHLPQVHGQPLPDKEDAMNMVRHHLDGHHLYLRIVAMNAKPLALDGLAKFRQFYTRFVLYSIGLIIDYIIKATASWKFDVWNPQRLSIPSLIFVSAYTIHS